LEKTGQRKENRAADDVLDARPAEHVGRILVEPTPRVAQLGGAREVDEEQRWKRAAKLAGVLDDDDDERRTILEAEEAGVEVENVCVRRLQEAAAGDDEVEARDELTTLVRRRCCT
jgi:hypothetical protein